MKKKKQLAMDEKYDSQTSRTISKATCMTMAHSHQADQEMCTEVLVRIRDGKTGPVTMSARVDMVLCGSRRGGSYAR